MNLLVKQILPPLIVAMPHQPHDVARRVEIERARFAHGAHVGFVRQSVAFAAIAGMAAGDKVFPRREPTPRAGNDVVERKFS